MRKLALVPAYNEEVSVGSVVDGAMDHVDHVVVIDDGSDDATARKARERGATVVRHAINCGVGCALRTGYQFAIRSDFDVLVQIDADGQHDPAYLPELLDGIEENDVVIGSRYLNDSISDFSLTRRAGIRFFTKLVNVLGGVEVTDVTSGYRAYDVRVLETIMHTSDAHWAVEQTLQAAKAELQIEEVSVEMPVRESGTSQFTLDTFVLYPLRMIDTIFRIVVFR